MAEIKQLIPIVSKPGIQRDGTVFDANYFTDGQWCRFQRGKPKKMGGYKQISDSLSGPIRNVVTWARETTNVVLSFSKHGIEEVFVDLNGLGSNILDRTPSGWTSNEHSTWTVTTQYDDKVGSQGTAVIAHRATSLKNIDDSTATKPYIGLLSDTAAFTEIADAPAVSGGVVGIAPYLLVYGSDGFVGWSDANLPQNWYTGSYNYGDSGADRVTSSKIVRGLPLRSGSGPAGLLWSLDSVIRMEYVGGGAIFKFTHLSSQSSIMSAMGVVEYDGVYYWMGVDRFLMSDGGQVRELPNQMNINWVFDNLRLENRQKVWATKIPRFGEIWWFFPFGEAEECTHAVIYNVREQTWYDTRCSRSAGHFSQSFPHPIWAEVEPSGAYRISLSGVSGSFATDHICNASSGGRWRVLVVSGSSVKLRKLSGPDLSVGDLLVDSQSGATGTVAAVDALYGLDLHEVGVNAVTTSGERPIESYFTTSDLSLVRNFGQQGMNRFVRLVRVEPDFIQSEPLLLEVLSREFPNTPEVVSSAHNFTNETDKIDLRVQARELRIRVTSNALNGNYEMGHVMLHVEPGDIRS